MEFVNFEIPELTSRLLERRKYALHQYFSREVLETLDVEVAEGAIGYCLDQMLIRLRIDLYGEKIAVAEQTHEIEIPLTWWEMFKRDRMPEWFRRRYPVRYKTAIVKFTGEQWRLYPNADLPLSGDRYGAYVRVADYSKSVLWDVPRNDEP